MLKFNLKVVQKRSGELVLGLSIEPTERWHLAGGEDAGGGAASPAPSASYQERTWSGAFVQSKAILAEG